MPCLGHPDHPFPNLCATIDWLLSRAIDRKTASEQAKLEHSLLIIITDVNSHLIKSPTVYKHCDGTTIQLNRYLKGLHPSPFVQDLICHVTFVFLEVINPFSIGDGLCWGIFWLWTWLHGWSFIQWRLQKYSLRAKSDHHMNWHALTAARLVVGGQLWVKPVPIPAGMGMGWPLGGKMLAHPKTHTPNGRYGFCSGTGMGTLGNTWGLPPKEKWYECTSLGFTRGYSFWVWFWRGFEGFVNCEAGVTDNALQL